jgi:hypothetical protein
MSLHLQFLPHYKPAPFRLDQQLQLAELVSIGYAPRTNNPTRKTQKSKAIHYSEFLFLWMNLHITIKTDKFIYVQNPLTGTISVLHEGVQE